jgi:hypothetical protein
MTLKEQLQQAADAGRQQKIEDEQRAAEERIAAERRRAEEVLACTEAAKKHLESLPARMQTAAKRGDAECQVHIVDNKDIDFPKEYHNGQPLDPAALKGLSRRIFELLQEAELEPKVVNLPPHNFLIKVPVPPAAA